MKKFSWFAIATVTIGLSVGASVQVLAATSAPATAGSTFDQRLVQRKAEHVVSLSVAEQTRLINKCAGVQNTIRTVQVKQVSQLADRLKVYHRIDAKLLVVIGELKLADKDTFELEKQRLELANQTVALQTTVSSFNQAVDDTLVINCKADSAGFQSLIETVRDFYAGIQTQSADIHDLVVNNIKSELTSQGDSLQTKTVTDKAE